MVPQADPLPGGTGVHDHYPDAMVGSVLETARTIALVGASANPARPSFLVLKYLVAHGYRVYPVNPALAGGAIAGLPVAARLADLPEPIDMVDIFRRSEAAGGVVDEALALDPKPRIIWMQLGVRDDEAAARAEGAGLTVIMNRCPKIEYGRLSGEIGWSGINSRVLSAKRPRLAAGQFQKRLLNR